MTNAASSGKRKKTVEQTFTKLSQLEHVLLRPDTYIGSTERVQQMSWVWDDEKNRMAQRDITYSPGLYKIFDEILVNAADHSQRDKNMNSIKVEIDPENRRISVWNNGSGIPVEIHKKENIYVPELIFGHLLTSSNYDDEEKKVVGGRNGYGAKLANIFSMEFVVDTADAVNGKRFKQTFRNNMSSKGKASIRENPKNEAYTKITFSPDLARFGMEELDKDIVSLLKKRVYDIAGVNSSLRVYLNGSRIHIKSFKDYVALYPTETASPVVHERFSDRWEVAVCSSDGQMNQMSFVNSIWTVKGGTQVTHVADMIVAKVAEHIAKKNKGMTVKPFQVKSHLSLFINSRIENPAFDSQTKETLTTKPSKFGSRWSFTDEFAKKVLSKTTIVENVLAFARFKQSKELAKTDGGKKARVIGVPKLDDANKAGSREASKCTLILTEGDSAKALAVSGLSVVGRDYYGVFPLRGKLLNVRDAKHKQIMDNAEINNLKKILGLQHNKKYDADSVKSLRYGHVLIMADQDHDGSHIKGLVINFFDHFWPSLLQVNGFIQVFITPIVKCVKGNQERVFFTIPQYREWAESTEGSQTGWRAKYYKGLGTSTAAEAKAYFSNLLRHLHRFRHRGADDTDQLELAFSKQRISDRKEWLTAFTPGTYFDHDRDELNYSNFVNKELILFSVADNARSIPSVIDGLKPSQRKVLYACFKRKLTKNEIKVVQLAGYVSEHAAYHHGEMSLQATIVGLAQNFVGSNNINLLVPAGQFGTRLQGGKDAASSRYIFTKLSPTTRALMPEVDDPLLSYLEEDGMSIEPQWYCPIIPLVLVNGSDGIGTGWSSSVPCYNPRDLIKNVHSLLDGKAIEPMLPWYRGFKGSMVPVENSKSYDVYGVVRRGNEAHTLRIDELPIRSWTTPYKEFLEASVIGVPDAKQPFVRDFRDNSTENNVRFTITTTAEQSTELQSSNAYKRLKLVNTISTNNMVLFDAEGRIRKYNSPEEIMDDFFEIRLQLYDQRREYLLQELKRELACLDNKQRFILMVIEGTLQVSNRRKADILAELKRLSFDPISRKKSPLLEADGGEQDAEDGNSAALEKDSGYDYLLSMPLWSLTAERVEQLRKQRDAKCAQKEEMESTTGKQLWRRDLESLETALNNSEEEMEKLVVELEKVAREAQKKQRGASRRRGQNRSKSTKSIVYDETSDEDDVNVISVPSARSVSTKGKEDARLKALKGTGAKTARSGGGKKPGPSFSWSDSEPEGRAFSSGDEPILIGSDGDESRDDDEILPNRISRRRRAPKILNDDAGTSKHLSQFDDDDIKGTPVRSKLASCPSPYEIWNVTAGGGGVKDSHDASVEFVETTKAVSAREPQIPSSVFGDANHGEDVPKIGSITHSLASSLTARGRKFLRATMPLHDPEVIVDNSDEAPMDSSRAQELQNKTPSSRGEPHKQDVDQSHPPNPQGEVRLLNGASRPARPKRRARTRDIINLESDLSADINDVAVPPGDFEQHNKLDIEPSSTEVNGPTTASRQPLPSVGKPEASKRKAVAKAAVQSKLVFIRDSSPTPKRSRRAATDRTNNGRGETLQGPTIPEDSKSLNPSRPRRHVSRKAIVESDEDYSDDAELQEETEEFAEVKQNEPQKEELTPSRPRRKASRKMLFDFNEDAEDSDDYYPSDDLGDDDGA